MTRAIVAVDDHPIVVEGLMSLISRADSSLALARATTGWPELKACLDSGEVTADVALVDLNRNDGTEPEAPILGLVQRGIPVVILTSELRPVPIRRAIEAGALGLALKSDPVEQIIDVVEGALQGELRCSSDLAFVLVSDPQIQARLAPREIEALSLLADGWPRKQVGAQMDPPCSMTTVVTYINRAVERYRDLGRSVGTSSDVVREATVDGYLDFPAHSLTALGHIGTERP